MADVTSYGYDQPDDSIRQPDAYGQPPSYQPGSGPSYPPSQSHQTTQSHQASYNSNTSVVIQQPQSQMYSRPPLRAWNTGVCSCFDDMGICCCGLFCGSCLASSTSEDLGEHCCVPCCVPGAMTALRLKLRTQENIEGSLMNDCCTMTWCGPCGLCQLAREARFVKRRSTMMPMGLPMGQPGANII